MTPDSQKKARTALVTGGANGMGLAIANRLLDDGCTVVVVDASPSVHTAFPAELLASGRLRPLQLDLMDDEAVIGAAAELVAEFGSVDILVNNAGINPKKDGGKYLVEEISRELWDAVVQVNLRAPFLLVRELLPPMKSAGWGRIVNIASAGALGHTLNSAASYVVSKSGLIGLTRTVAEEAARFGVTANCVAPGPVETALTAQSSAETIAKTVAMIPVGRYGQPTDIAAMVSFLSSDEASFITGTVMSVDGGVVMR
ncbi:SDR family NAD(P)-dependent oxidoreductase [Microbacterium sp. NPDC077663]|uniref:SDR family NAD(P)-dependent oxidoreductase n=1 Tax=Microbacterium sp. NPDC077663 TaxID=3364189 RepID=UPI0037CB1FAD